MQCKQFFFQSINFTTHSQALTRLEHGQLKKKHIHSFAEAGNTPEYHFHKVQKFTYAQTLKGVTMTGDGFSLSPTIRS